MRMSERDFIALLLEALDQASYDDPESWPDMVAQDFRSNGYMTNNEGVVVNVGGSEFQLTVVRVK